jgi:hypothetical protein
MNINFFSTSVVNIDMTHTLLLSNAYVKVKIFIISRNCLNINIPPTEMLMAMPFYVKYAVMVGMTLFMLSGH